VVTFKSAGAIREAAAWVPLDRLLVETDCPYLAPVPMRGKRNEPAFVAHTANAVAQLRGLAPAELARATTDNSRRLFRLH
jgi:TatD DNase family protein